MLVAMTVLPSPRPVCVLEHLVVEVDENKSQTENDTEFAKSFFSCLCTFLEMSRSLFAAASSSLAAGA